MAHEAFHYLRRTRQMEGRHGEIEADALALKTLEQYRDGRYAKGGKKLCWDSKPAPG